MTVLTAPRVVHALAGRLRVHCPETLAAGELEAERIVGRLPGVVRVRANARTGNVVVEFDESRTDADSLLHRLAGLRPPRRPRGRTPAAVNERRPSAITERRGSLLRTRIAVPGLERDRRLGRAAVLRLRSVRGVRRVVANPLTGRVLVEYEGRKTTIDDLLAEVSGLELPDLPADAEPEHPLDPAPLIRSGARAVGASLGLTLLAARRASGRPGPPVASSVPTVAAGTVGLVEAFPAVRDGARSLLGETGADLLFGVSGAATLSLSGNPLGLALSLAIAVRMATEARERRAGWRRYENHLMRAPSAHPGATIRLDDGDHAPLAGTVLEGRASLIRADGTFELVGPGARVEAGEIVHGAKTLVVRLDDDAGLMASESHDGAPPPRLYAGYLQTTGRTSLAAAALAGLVTRSPAAMFTSLLLVNARPAVVGYEMAETGARARVQRSGAILPGTRRRRLERPDLLVVDGVRGLGVSYTIGAVEPPAGPNARERLLRCAGALSAGARLPCAAALAGSAAGDLAHCEQLTDAVRGRLDGEDVSMRVAAAGERLVLDVTAGGAPAGSVSLGMVPARSAEALVSAARRLGVQVALVPETPAGVARPVIRALGLTCIPGSEVERTIRDERRSGRVVAVLSDRSCASGLFEAADLGIGLATPDQDFPAAADVLVFRPEAIAELLETMGRRQTAVLDAVMLSAASNVAGAVWGIRGGPGLRRASYAVHLASLAAVASGAVRLRGGGQAWQEQATLADPQPERWGARTVEDVAASLSADLEQGLSEDEAARRLRLDRPAHPRRPLLDALREQGRSPVTLALTAGAAVSLALGSAADLVLIGAVLAANAGVGYWQERQAGEAAAALHHLTARPARVLRDGKARTAQRSDIVPGDVLLLASGDHVAADARVVADHALELNESALTGESLPVA
jgi:cation transport ATPase